MSDTEAGTAMVAEETIALFNERTSKSVGDVLAERERQRGMWGDSHDDEHSSCEWTALVNAYATRSFFWTTPNMPEHIRRELRGNFRRSMVKAAALALAAVEWCDRQAEKSEAQP